MDKRKKAPPGAGTPGRATERGAASQAGHQLHVHSTTSRRDRQAWISSLLRSGPLTLRELEALTGLDGRTIRRMIELERRGGLPIVSDKQRGYWLGDPAEIRRFARSMRRRAAEITATAQAVEEAISD